MIDMTELLVRLQPHWFSSDTNDAESNSYDAFIYAAKCANSLMRKANEYSHAILADSYGNTYNLDNIKVVYDNEDSYIVVDCVYLVGCTHEETGEIYCTKSEVRGFFKDIKLLIEEPLILDF